MKNSLVYRFSIGLSVLLTLAAFITLLGWFGTLARGMGHLTTLAMIPWQPMGLVLLAALNCTLRARLIVRRELVGK